MKHGIFGYGITDSLKRVATSAAKEAAKKEFSAAAHRVMDFIKERPTSKKVLGYLCGLGMLVYGWLWLFIHMLTFNCIGAAMDMFIVVCGCTSVAMEYKFELLPGLYAFLLQGLPCILSPYGRPHMYMFIGFLIISDNSLANIYQIEGLVLGVFIALAAFAIFVQTFISKSNINVIKTANIPEEILKGAFNKADTSKNGQLDNDEFCCFLNNLEVYLDKNDLDTILIELDVSGDGEISWSEFVRWYYK